MNQAGLRRQLWRQPPRSQIALECLVVVWGVPYLEASNGFLSKPPSRQIFPRGCSFWALQSLLEEPQGHFVGAEHGLAQGTCAVIGLACWPPLNTNFRRKLLRGLDKGDVVDALHESKYVARCATPKTLPQP
jgi:hypothetical protein